MAPRPKPKPKAPQPQPPAPKPVHQRGQEWEAEKLTGKRDQKGKTFRYEVQWKQPSKGPKWANSFEPASCLVNWEADMKKVDAALEKRANEPTVNQAQLRAAARELEAKKKATELLAHRDRLLRRQKRQRGESVNGLSDDDDDGSDSDGSENGGDEEARAIAAQMLAAELLVIEAQLAKQQGGTQPAGRGCRLTL